MLQVQTYHSKFDAHSGYKTLSKAKRENGPQYTNGELSVLQAPPPLSKWSGLLPLVTSHIFLNDFTLSFIYVHVRVCAYKGQARALKAPKQEMQAVGNHLSWTLETEFGSCERAANVVSH